MTKQITLEEVLELVSFKYDDARGWQILDVKCDVTGDVCADVYGEVCGEVFEDGGVEAEIRYQRKLLSDELIREFEYLRTLKNGVD